VERSGVAKIRAYYGEILGDFSVNDLTHMLHYLPKMLATCSRWTKLAGDRAGGREGFHAAPLGSPERPIRLSCRDRGGGSEVIARASDHFWSRHDRGD
jgi:hypothetical protein